MKVAVCLVVKNERHDISAWISHHLRLGFDAALIYDNGSTDGTDAVVEAAGAIGDVRLHGWGGGQGTQHDAYLAAMRRHADEFDWIAVLDADEYLVLNRAGTVAELCRAAPPWADAVAINWAIFGSNGHVERPAGPVPAAFTRRAPDDFPPNRHVKSIVRPAAVRGCLNPHAFDVAGRTVRPSNDAVRWAIGEDGHQIVGVTAGPPDYSVAQINHYFTRSRAHWSARLARGNFYAVRTWDDFDAYDRNEVEDRSAARWLAQERIVPLSGFPGSEPPEWARWLQKRAPAFS